MKTMLAVYLPVDLAMLLGEMAQEKHVSRNQFIADSLSNIATGKALDSGFHARATGNRDGREKEALAIIREYPCDSSRELVERLEEVGIKRGRNWVCEKRRQLVKRHD